jgi:hypothetical protein
MNEVRSKTGPLGPECFENDLPDLTDEEIAARYPQDFHDRTDAAARRNLEAAKKLRDVSAVPPLPEG